MAHLNVLAGEEANRARPVVRSIRVTDLKEALARGFV